jgi:N,N'-diacetyllegionaminate synthase
VSKVFIIAEAGVNHNGDVRVAKEMIEIAAEAKVDAIKFQTWKTELMVTKFAKQAEYQILNTSIVESQFDMLKKLELTYDEFVELKIYCDKLNIQFMSTPDELESAAFLSKYQEIFKIGSGNVTNLPLLRFIGCLQKQIILSTGMSTLEEIKSAINVLEKSGTQRSHITLLHCTTQYPAPMNELNLSAISHMRHIFNLSVGYSDHSSGIEASIAAVALGATVIEKHFTLDCNLPGPDHKASLDPLGLKNLVISIRNIEDALGSGEKKVTDSESANIPIARKSIVTTKPIKKGEIFTIDNLGVKRPGIGVSPMEWDSVIGRKSARNYAEDELIEI